MPEVTKQPNKPLKKLREKVREIRRQGEEVSVFFFDEARFGLKPCVGRAWCRRGGKPTVPIKPGYSNFYVYSGVNVETGEECSSFLPTVNTEMMSLYLAHLHQTHHGRSLILVMDQPDGHKSKGLNVPKDIEIEYLPPYSPELNPVEHLRQWLRRHFLSQSCL